MLTTSIRLVVTGHGRSKMGLVALVCALILLVIIPNEIWSVVFYLAFLALVAFIGWWAFVIWVLGG